MRQAGPWLVRLQQSRHALWLLGTMSFLETIIVPIPIEIVLVPFMAANRTRVWTIATVTMTGCLLASLAGYGLGYFAYESAGRWLIETLQAGDAYDRYLAFFHRHGFLAIVVVGILPIPFQVAMIGAGLSGYPVTLFIVAAVIARGARYYGLAWLVLRFGTRVHALWQRHAVVVTVGAVLTLVALIALGNHLAGYVR